MDWHKSRTVAALAVLAAVAAGQTLGTPGVAVAPASSGEKQCMKLVVLVQEGVAVDALSAEAKCLLVAGNPDGGVYLFESAEPISPLQMQDFTTTVSKLPGVLHAEMLQPTTLPELEACGQPVDVSGQQCTVAFADATPSAGEFSGQDALQVLDFEWGQNLSQHHPVLVAVIDTGIDPAHPALAGHVAGDGYDFVADRLGGVDQSNGLDDDGDGYVDEAHGHGTHIASVVLLINPDARILPLRVLDADGNGDSYDVADAILYAVDHGANLINLSLSMKQPSAAVSMALEYARLMGVSVFVAAGNTSKKKVLFPANYDPRTFQLDVPLLPVGWKPSADAITAIASTDAQGHKAAFSAWGPTVDLVAPGVEIYGAMPGGGYAWWSGTSMSTAVATGVASLALSVGGPDMPISASQLLKKTAEPVDQLNPAYAGGLGKGYVDAAKAAWEAKKYN